MNSREVTLSWGSSIRGAWWDAPHQRKIEYNSCGLYLDDEQITDLEFTRDEWMEFIAAVIQFAAEQRSQDNEKQPQNP